MLNLQHKSGILKSQKYICITLIGINQIRQEGFYDRIKTKCTHRIRKTT